MLAVDKLFQYLYLFVQLLVNTVVRAVARSSRPGEQSGLTKRRCVHRHRWPMNHRLYADLMAR